jgi:hypothetical protein
MVVNDNAGSLTPRGAQACIASIRAPTGSLLQKNAYIFGVSVGLGARLHRLASPPTPTPESAGLCALALVSMVSLSLPIQRSGFAARINQGAQRHRFLSVGVFSSVEMRYGGCARETFGSAGFLDSRSANLRTAVTFFVSQRTVAAPSIKELHHG